MIVHRLTVTSALAFAALACVSSNASAHGLDNHDRPANTRRDHELFHREEAARREIQDKERADRSSRRRLRFERERRELLRVYSMASPQYRGFVARWERRWNDAVERERRLMISQREAARERHRAYHLAVEGVDHLSLDAACIDRELAKNGVTAFPYNNDNRFGRVDGPRVAEQFPNHPRLDLRVRL
jgi:hypothetical protein